MGGANKNSRYQSFPSLKNQNFIALCVSFSETKHAKFTMTGDNLKANTVQC